MDNVRTDCSYQELSLPRHFKCLTSHRVNWRHVVFSPTAVTAAFGIFFFFFFFYITHMTSVPTEELLLYLLATNVITLGRPGKPKVLKSSKWWAEGSVGFCISHLLRGFKKKGDRGQLNMHIIWGYIQSLGFKLLDERQLWINVIFSLKFGHLLRARKKSLCMRFWLLIFLITVPWDSLSS